MRGVTAVISKILVLNPGVRLAHLSTAPVKVIDGESVVVNACAVFEDDKLSSKGELYSSLFLFEIVLCNRKINLCFYILFS
jgi:hypothetical protein